MTRRRALWVASATLAVAVAVFGVVGAVGYGQDYNLRRGFSTLVQFKRAGTGRLEEVHFYSRALHREADYLIYLPPHWTPTRQYPAYYLLHGSPGKPQVFVDIANMDIRLDNQMAIGASRPMILVYPDGRIDNNTYSDSEWANTPSGDYASYVLDVVHNVDAQFSAIPNRQDRVIAGFSAGAFGAVNIALHYPSTFADVQSWSGYFTETPTAVFTHASPALLAANSPVEYIRHIHAELRRYPLRAYLFVGRDDSSYSQQAPMVRQLIAAGVAEQHAVYPGGHDWGVWYPRLDQMLDMASEDVATAPTWIPPSSVHLPAARPPVSHPAVRHASSTATGTATPRGGHHRRHHRSELALIASLLLALLSAALINLGFVLQHRGHEHARETQRAGRLGTFSDGWWLAGQLVGWAGFGGQVVAVALAPLTLVQAFSAGSLALSVPFAAAAFGHRVDRRQALAIAAIAVSLATLPVGVGRTHGQLEPGLLIAAALVVLLADAVLLHRAGALVSAVLGGAFYGVADAAIKAESIGLRFHGGSIFTGWTLLAILCTGGGFLAFQAALARGDAVRPLSLMNAVTAVAAIALGIAAFGEQLGVNALADALHIAAICVVIAAASTLARAQQPVLEAADSAAVEPAPTVEPVPTVEPGRGVDSAPAPRASRIPARLARTGASVWVPVAVLLGGVCAVGLIYELRQAGLFSLGPRVGDSLPLLQLAGFSGQPLSRVIVAALAAGLLVGLALIWMPRRRRVAVVGVLAIALLLISSDASTALAHNVRFGQLLEHRAPGLGPWLSAVLLAGACALPGPRIQLSLPAALRRLDQRRVLSPVLAGLVAVIVALALITPASRATPQPATASGPAAATPPVPAPTTPSPAAALGRLARETHPAPSLAVKLDSTLAAARRHFHAPAATAAMALCGRLVWADASGVADLRTGARATNATLFVMNSAVKTIVATMIMEEVQAHRLSLRTPLARFYPQLPDAHAITVEMLLNMTSGLPEYLTDPAIQAMVTRAPEHRWTVDQILTGLGTGLGHVLFTPGSRYSYSDTNYIALGGILTQVTHRPLQADFETLIARPLHISGASWQRTPAARAHLAQGYDLSLDGHLSDVWIPGYGPASTVWGPVFTDGGLAASSVDLARFANDLLAGRLLGRAALAQMTDLGPQHQYGFGIRAKTFAGVAWLGHGGAYQGYDAEDWTDPHRQLTIAVSANLLAHRGQLTSNAIWQALAREVDALVPASESCAAHSALATAGL